MAAEVSEEVTLKPEIWTVRSQLYRHLVCKQKLANSQKHKAECLCLHGPLPAIGTMAQAEADENNWTCGIFGLLSISIPVLHHHISPWNVPRNHQHWLALCCFCTHSECSRLALLVGLFPDVPLANTEKSMCHNTKASGTRVQVIILLHFSLGTWPLLCNWQNH